MDKSLSNMDIEIVNENGDKILTFKDTHSFQHWLKSQRKTSFSVPVRMKGSDYAFQYISVTKRSMQRLHLVDNEVIEVFLNKSKFGDRYCAYVEPKRIPRL
jgi:hypothetical protein